MFKIKFACCLMLLISAPLFALTDKFQKARSQELFELVSADQKERENFEKMTTNDYKELSKRDKIRRKKVGALMKKGPCKLAKDYAAAALVYQHGDTPEEYYQAFLWANKAVALGDLKEKSLVAMTIDRYLNSIGKKQLFGTQFQATDTDGWCSCLLPVEPTFPDSYRIRFSREKLSKQYKMLQSLNRGKKHCLHRECPMHLSPTPRGSIPGFW